MLTQTFAGATPGQSLSGYSEGGGTWSSTSAPFKFSTTLNPPELYIGTSGSGGAVGLNSYVPASANYSVEAALYALNTNGQVCLIGRASGGNYYLMQYDGADFRLLYWNGSYHMIGTTTGVHLQPGFNRLSFKMLGSVLSVILNGSTILSCSDGNLSAAGAAGLMAPSAAVTDMTGVHITQFVVNDAPNVAASVTGRTSAAISLSASATDGYGAYSYQWHRSQTSGFTPSAGTAISGATSATLTDSPGSLGIWFYKCLVTDAAGAVGTSLQLASALLRPAIKIGWIGDSILSNTWGSGSKTIPALVQDRLSRAINRPVAISNQAIGGTRTIEWLPSGAILGPAITAMVAAFGTPNQATNPVYVMVSIGVNDYLTPPGTPVATYSANMTAIVGALVAAGFTPILNTPMLSRSEPQPNWHVTDNGIEIGRQYSNALDLIAVGGAVLRGTDWTWEYTGTHTGEQLQDVYAPGMCGHVHPTQDGAESYSYQYLAALVRLIP